MKTGCLLALDQGTTSTRALVFDADMSVLATAQCELALSFPRPGWVEQSPEDIWQTSLLTIRKALAQSGKTAADIAALGLTNQRETTLIWERDTGRPVHPAIVWQDRRTAAECDRLRDEGHEGLISARTGLLPDPYFSASKIAWLLDQDSSLRRRAEAGELAFGTVDSFLLWRLTGGTVHRTDATNASRTLLFDIRKGQWDADMLRLFAVPEALLPEVCDCAADFGRTAPELFGGAIRIGGIAGDQQAAAIGQACLQPGMLKCTYGTGCFALLHTGSRVPVSQHRLLTTIACQLGGQRSYALEGSIFVAGAAVQWLRDGLQILSDAAQSGPMAAAADPAQKVIMVPAFTGLGAPHWDSEARGAIFGLTREVGREELARAALEAVCYQTRDLLQAMRRDMEVSAKAGSKITNSAQEKTGGDMLPILRVDGGMSASDWTMQFLADILGAPVDRPRILETTALGAACLAGLQAGLLPSLSAITDNWQRQRRFQPKMAAAQREQKYADWQQALSRTLSSAIRTPSG